MKKLFTILAMLVAVSASGQWVQQYTGTTADLYGISFLNENTGYVCGGTSILKTTNGGTNWLNVNTINLLKPFMNIQAIDENIVYCVGMFNTIIKSTNGGINWSILRNGPSGTGFSLYSLYFINSQTGWIGGQSATPHILKTTNGGVSFDSIATNNLLNRVNDFYFLNSNTGLACGDLGIVRKTTNGGLNWNNVNIPIGTYLPNFNNFSFINSFTGFTSTDVKRVYKTTDFGDNWDSLSYIPNTYPSIDQISFSSESKGWAVGSGYDVFHTTNGGMNWFTQGGWNAHCILFINDTVGYKAGNSGGIYKTTNGGMTTFINPISTETPSKYSLSQNYPNPFNPTTNIKFSIVNSGEVKLVVYDIQGREVQTLVNESLKPGTYEAAFDGSALNSGVYFYKLVTGNFTETKKMILIK